MRVLAACSLGGAGHLQPLVPFLAAAERRGAETLVVGPPALRDLVGRTGHRFHAGDEPPESAVAPIRDLLPRAPAVEASRLANRELFGRLATAAMLPTVAQLAAEWAPDLIVREPCEYASAVVAGRSGLPVVQVGISLADTEAGSIAVAAPALEDHRPGLADELLAMPYLTRLPASLDPSPFPSTVRYRERPVDPGPPLPDWWGGSDEPLVYLTFGTVLGHMSMAADVYRAALAAVAGSATRVLLTVGHTLDRSKLGPIPANVHVEPWVDQARVLTEAELVVCHGGSGSAFGALAAGLPLVVVPAFADQFDNGRRIAEAGAGLVVEAAPAGPGEGRRPVSAARDAGRIAAAIDEVLAEGEYRKRAEELAAEVAAAPTVDEVLARFVDRAGPT